MSQIGSDGLFGGLTPGSFIKTDGTSTTTASIPFALGLSVPDSPSFGIQAPITIGGAGPGAETGLFGNTTIKLIDDGGLFARYLSMENSSVTSGSGLGYIFSAGHTSAASQTGGFGQFTAGSNTNSATGGSGGDVLFNAGGGRKAGFSGGVIQFQGGTGTAGANYGYTRVGTGTPNRFTLSSANTLSSLYVTQALEVDGITYGDGGFRANDGSASAPSYAFSSTTNTGMYLSSSGPITLALGTVGSPQIELINSGIVKVSSVLRADSSLSRDLGSTVTRWNTLYAGGINLKSSGNTSFLMQGSSGDVMVFRKDPSSDFLLYNQNDVRNELVITETGVITLGNAGIAISIPGDLTIKTSLTGLLKATSGVVSTATAGTDYVHTLSVTSPILNIGSAADPNIALDETANYSWTGAHEFRLPSTITLDEDIKLYIGDNNSGLGRLSLQYNSGTSQVELADEDSYIGNGAKFSIQPNILVDPNLNGYSQFGATPQLVAPNNSNDTLVVGRSFDGVVTGAKRAGFFETYYTGSTSHAGFNAGLNAFASTTSGSSGNLTASTQSGGLSGGRYRTAHAGLGLVSLSTGISILTSWTGSGNTTEAIGLQIETPIKTLLGGPVNWYGIKLPDMSGGAIASTATYGIYVQPIKSNYPVWFASNAEAFFRESGNKIYSSGAAALDVIATTTLNATAGTTVNLQAGGSSQVSVASGTITLKDAVNFVGNTGTGNKIGTGTTQKWGFFNATPVAQQTATTDLGTVLSNLGFRAAGTAYPITTSGNILFNGGTFEIRKDVPLIQLTDTTTGSSDDYSIDVGAAAVSRFRIRNTTDATTVFDVDGTNRIAMSTNYAPQAAYKVYVQDRDTAASPAANYAALSSSFEYLPAATTTTMGSNLHGYQGGVTAYASNGNISGGGAFFGLRGDATVFLGNATTQSNSAVGLFASYAQSQLSGTGGTAAQGSGVATFLSVGANSTLTAGYHIRVGSTSNSGTITTLYGIYIPAITSGSTNYELFLDTNAREYFRDGNQYIYSSAASTLDDSANTTRNFRIGGTIELALTATQLDLMSATTDRVNFIGGAGATAPSTSIGAAIVNYYGSSATNFLGDPVAWLEIKVNGTTRKVPLY